MVKVVDTNYLVRLFTGQPAAQRSEVLSTMKQAQNGSILLPDYVLSELIYVLEFHDSLRFTRRDIVSGIHKVLDHPAWRYDKPLHQAALAIYATEKLDYVDCLVAAEQQLARAQAILSFDKQLLKYCRS